MVVILQFKCIQLTYALPGPLMIVGHYNQIVISFSCNTNCSFSSIGGMIQNTGTRSCLYCSKEFLLGLTLQLLLKLTPPITFSQPVKITCQ